MVECTPHVVHKLARGDLFQTNNVWYRALGPAVEGTNHGDRTPHYVIPILTADGSEGHVSVLAHDVKVHDAGPLPRSWRPENIRRRMESARRRAKEADELAQRLEALLNRPRYE